MGMSKVKLSKDDGQIQKKDMKKIIVHRHIHVYTHYMHVCNVHPHVSE